MIKQYDYWMNDGPGCVRNRNTIVKKSADMKSSIDRDYTLRFAHTPNAHLFFIEIRLRVWKQYWNADFFRMNWTPFDASAKIDGNSRIDALQFSHLIRVSVSLQCNWQSLDMFSDRQSPWIRVWIGFNIWDMRFSYNRYDCAHQLFGRMTVKKGGFDCDYYEDFYQAELDVANAFLYNVMSNVR